MIWFKTNLKITQWHFEDAALDLVDRRKEETLFSLSSFKEFYNLIDTEILRPSPLQPLKIAGDKQTSGKHFVGLSQPVMCFVFFWPNWKWQSIAPIHILSQNVCVFSSYICIWKGRTRIEEEEWKRRCLNISEEFVTALTDQTHRSRGKWIIDSVIECQRSDWQINYVLNIKRN